MLSVDIVGGSYLLVPQVCVVFPRKRILKEGCIATVGLPETTAFHLPASVVEYESCL